MAKVIGCSVSDDGHPDLCAEVIDIMGDARDEIILWMKTRCTFILRTDLAKLQIKNMYLKNTRIATSLTIAESSPFQGGEIRK